MRLKRDLGCAGVTVPANTQTATFVRAGPWRPTAGANTARSIGEMRLLIGSGEAQPGVQFANAWDGSLSHQAVGTNITANGTSPPPPRLTSAPTRASTSRCGRAGW